MIALKVTMLTMRLSINNKQLYLFIFLFATNYILNHGIFFLMDRDGQQIEHNDGNFTLIHGTEMFRYKYVRVACRMRLEKYVYTT